VRDKRVIPFRPNIALIPYLDGVFAAADLKGLSRDKRRNLSGRQGEAIDGYRIGRSLLNPKASARVTHGTNFAVARGQGEIQG
jgi:hypothetical protein